eukprot:scaffold57176_cov43-Prasinocladus_malaysianus.AAC.1
MYFHAAAGDGATRKIKLSSKTGLPVAQMGAQSDGDDEGGHSGDSGAEEDTFSVASTIRRKDETHEEKKARKAAVKEAQLFLSASLIDHWTQLAHAAVAL